MMPPEGVAHNAGGAAAQDARVGETERLRQENDALRARLAGIEAAHEALRRSTSWRITAPLRLLGASLRPLLKRPRSPGPAASPTLLPLNDDNYRRWLALVDQASTERDRRLRATVAGSGQRITISLLLRVKDSPEALLHRAIGSVRAQIHPDWQLCIVDDASRAPHVARALGTYGEDARIEVVRHGQPGTAAAALGSALERARGALVGVIAADDVLHPAALAELALLAARHPAVAVAYCDEDAIDEAGRRASPRLKTDWNPDLLLTQPYLGGLCLYDRTLVERAGGFRDGFEGAEDYDLALRVTALAPAGAVRHLAAVLCHRGGSIERAANRDEACRRAAAESLRVASPAALVVPVPGVGSGHRIVWPRGPASVTVIVPTRDRADLLGRCADAVLGCGRPNLELLIVDNDSRDARALALLAKLATDPRVRVLPSPGPFNWSALNNAAVAVARGEVLVLLNNDVEMIDAGWLDEMVAQAMRPDVGAVGAKLLFADGRVQHAGVWLGPAGRARHLLRLSEGEDPGYLGQLALARNLSAVTGACLALRRAVFQAAGGLDERLRVSFNDLDLCLKIRELGYRIVFTPDARLRHLESASRGRADQGARAAVARAEHAVLRERWGERLDSDPFFNPNLDLIDEEVLALSWPTRHPAGS